jgi:Domain of unknown function (DU1801)
MPNLNVQKQILNYISSQPEPKQSEMQLLHGLILKLLPNGRLWFLDGKNSEHKVVANPNIGYGHYTIHYADGSSRDFYKIGLSANTTGISIYIMGIKDKMFLPQTFGNLLGKATVTGYCIKFKTISNINLGVLEDAIRYGIEYKL